MRRALTYVASFAPFTLLSGTPTYTRCASTSTMHHARCLYARFTLAHVGWISCDILMGWPPAKRDTPDSEIRRSHPSPRATPWIESHPTASDMRDGAGHWYGSLPLSLTANRLRSLNAYRTPRISAQFTTACPSPGQTPRMPRVQSNVSGS